MGLGVNEDHVALALDGVQHRVAQDGLKDATMDAKTDEELDEAESGAGSGAPPNPDVGAPEVRLIPAVMSVVKVGW